MVGENKMNSKEILAKIRELSNEEKRKINSFAKIIINKFEILQNKNAC